MIEPDPGSPQGCALLPASENRRTLGLVRTVLNLIWFVFSGLWLWIGYVMAGIICCLLIVTIPWGIASFRMANYAAWPFGREVVSKPTAGVFSFLGNVIWVIAAGWWLALTHIVTGALLCLTIIGIPLGVANFKLIPISLMPLGKQIVDRSPTGRVQPRRPDERVDRPVEVVPGVRGRHLGPDPGLAARHHREGERPDVDALGQQPVGHRRRLGRVADHHRHDRVVGLGDLEPARRHLGPEVRGVVPQPLEQVGRGSPADPGWRCPPRRSRAATELENR